MKQYYGDFDDMEQKDDTYLRQAFPETGEIDLHDYSTGVALAQFVSYYNDFINSKEIKVVHGYGSSGHGGEIRVRLRTYLADHSDCLRFEEGEKIDGNPGYTMVYPERSLPLMSASIEGKILEFCNSPKSEEKIFGKFRLYGDGEVKKAIKSLQRHGKIRPIDKGKHKLYQAISSA
jgi:hypothetical protein